MRNLFSRTRKHAERLGLFVPIDHPKVVQPRPPSFVYPAMLQRLERDSSATDAFISLVEPFMNDATMGSVRASRGADDEPYWDNGYFSGDDARLAYGYAATGLPRLVIEIGSGHSTRFLRKGINVHGHPTRIISIDPEPRSDIRNVVDLVIPSSVLDVDLTVFDELGPGDVLFWDGSHLVFNGTDTVRLFLEVLPALKPGVVIHIHDICLPGEYVVEFDGRGYNEQFILAAAPLFSDAWEILAPVLHLCAIGRLRHGGVSFWMRCRTGAE